MAANNNRIVFNEMKGKVGIDDVAYSLGYAINKKAGIGKYFELVLGSPSQPRDTIIVRNAPKNEQFYFRRDGSKGDVISFVRENISSFNVPGNDEWTKVGNALAQLANMPMVEIPDRIAVSKTASNRVFDENRYEVRQITSETIPYFLRKRGFDTDTVLALGENVVLIRDKRIVNFNGFNIGFPYHNPKSEKISGYEIRGNEGFKSKAAGTNSSSSFWSADFPFGMPSGSRNVYLFESAYDAIAFLILNKQKINHTPFSLVSVGGQFTPSQIEGVMRKYSGAKLWDCFDNDLAGNVFSYQLVRLAENKSVILDRTVDADGSKHIVLAYKNRSVKCPENDFSFRDAADEIGLNYNIGIWKAPENFKDWNDCLLGKQITPVLTESKYQRDRNLTESRKSSLKL